MRASRQQHRGGPGRLGTFAGVFTPSILTILGLILFLRVGDVVGNAGLSGALLILGLATLVSVLTSLSLAAIATNLRVRRGGDYYIISRTLGVEFGGAIGLVLFLAQSVSLAFYCIGFGEAVTMTAGLGSWLTPVIGASAVLFLLWFAWMGADWATRLQYLIMAVLVAALLSFFLGGIPRWSAATFTASLDAGTQSPGFWVLFAIFFPAVTGFTQGVSMSGDLKDPARSLPMGTFAAIIVSTAVYVGVMLVLAAALPRELLQNGYEAMRQASLAPVLIVAGVLAATLSSAMASFLGAPRVLQSLAGDRIIRPLVWFSRGVGPSQNPRRAVLLTAGIALIVIALGNLNAVATLVTMFFLVSYGLLNFATFIEARANSPAFRPTFRYFNAWLSLAAAVLCLGVGVAISPASAAIAGALLVVVHQYIRRTAPQSAWADSTWAYQFRRVRDYLFDMRDVPPHPRDWRPHILAFSKDPEHRADLVRFASWIEGEAGITTVARIFVGDDAGVRQRRDEAQREMASELAEGKLRAFPLAIAASDLMEGARVLLQSYGIGPLRANTILLNWIEQTARATEYELQEYGSYLRMTLRLKRNVIVLAAEAAGWERLESLASGRRRIDVWWSDDAGSRLSLMLAYLMTRTDPWERASVRVIAPARSDAEAAKLEDQLKELLEEVRIEAAIKTVIAPDNGTLLEQCSDAAVIFMPMRFHTGRLFTALDTPVQDVARGCPITALVMAAEDIELAPDPDEGELADAAAAVEQAEQSERLARKAEEQAIAASERATSLMNDAPGQGGDEEYWERLADAQREAERLSRRATKLRAKALIASAGAASAPPSSDGAAEPQSASQPSAPAPAGGSPNPQ